MSFKQKILGYHDIIVSPKMTVSSLQSQFEEKLGTKIRVYKLTVKGQVYTGRGSRPAAPEEELESVCVNGAMIPSITVQQSSTVESIEKQFADAMGVGIQIMTPDGNGFAPNNMKLSYVRLAFAEKPSIISIFTYLQEVCLEFNKMWSQKH